MALCWRCIAAAGQILSIKADPTMVGKAGSPPQATELPDNNSSVQVTTPANGDLALVFNAMSAEGVSERRTSLYDEIEEHDVTAAAKTATYRPLYSATGSC